MFHSEIHPLTRIEIENGLRQMGVCREVTVEVHSSLSSFGWVEGGAAAVVDALMNVIGKEGNLVMSAYPVSKPLPLKEEEKARGILAKVRLYELEYDGPTGMGAIADEFRHRPGTVLGPGFHRVCCWGRNSGILSEGYHRLLEMDGQVLLLGVGIQSCSSMHQAEKAEIIAEIMEYFELPDELRRDYPANIHLAYGNTPYDAWEKVREEAEARGLIKRQQIGSARCMLFRARPVVKIYEDALRNDPFSLYGVQRGQSASH